MAIVNIDLRKVFTEVIKKVCIKKIELTSETNETSREAFLACRLIPLDKNPGLRHI